jgi:Peptidase family M23
MQQKKLYLIGIIAYISFTIVSITFAIKTNEILTQPYRISTSNRAIGSKTPVGLLFRSNLTPTSKGITYVKHTNTGSTPGSIPKVKPRITPTATPVQQQPNYTMPNCYWHPGWFYNPPVEYGTDFDCGFHTQAIALWSGTVVVAERTCWDNSCTSTSGGLVIVVALVPDYGYQDTYYLHLDVVFVHPGEKILKGQSLGLTGGQVGYGNWPTSPWFTSGPHIEIGWDWYYAPIHLHCCNNNPLPAIEQAR